MKLILPKEKNLPSEKIFDGSWAYKSKNKIVRFVYFQRFKKALGLANHAQYDYILDIGTGCGILLPTLSNHGEKIIGLDVHNRFKELKETISKEKLKNILLIKADIRALPFKENAFDLIFCLSVMEHIKEVNKALSEIKRIMMVGSNFIIGYPIDAFLTKLGFRLSGILKEVENELHISDYRLLRKVVKNHFKILKKIKYPPGPIPDSFGFYEVVKCLK